MSHIQEAIGVTNKQVWVYLSTHNIPPTIDPEDLIHEAILRMLKCIGRYDPTKGDLVNFLELQTIGAIKDFLRKTDGYQRYAGKKTRLTGLTFLPKGSKEEVMIDIHDTRMNTEREYILKKELPRLLKNMSKALSGQDQLILNLRYRKGKKIRKIGDLLHIKEGSISFYHRRALRRFSGVLSSKGIVRMNQLLG
jgi:RNA polymerase sigma factor (sigma-70 family)